MISYIKGRVLEKGSNFLILENQGLGYRVFVATESLELPVGTEVAFFTYHKVSEDGQALYGLLDFKTLQFFELLLTVSGVGPKVAMSILSATKVESVKNAIASQDAGLFRRISGVGTKTAEKIIVELKGKVSESGLLVSQPASGEVFEALLALGYKQNEVRAVVGKLDSSQSPATQIREALRLLGKA